MAPHVHRNARLGPQVLINDTWYKPKPRDGTLSDVRGPLAIVREPCGRRGRYSVTRLNATSTAKFGHIRLVLSGAAPAITALFQDAVVWDAFIAVVGLPVVSRGFS